MSYHYSRPRSNNLPPPVQRPPKGSVPVVAAVVEPEVHPEVEAAVETVEAVAEAVEVPPAVVEPEVVRAVHTVEVVAEPVVVAEPEVVVEPQPLAQEPEVVEEHKAPLWKPSMNKSELLTIAASLGLTLTEENTKAQIVEALKNLDLDNA